ncbi:MAG: HEAT repeat domain-containing protein, partial [Deltaproteobacteria bacterium]|nr:HEAT repeat domain-containing protein [Deltaproteobacteria bacterium]
IACIVFPPLGIPFFIVAVVWVLKQPNPWGRKKYNDVGPIREVNEIASEPVPKFEHEKIYDSMSGKMKNLILSLDSDSFEKSENAEKTLINIGKRAVDSLAQASRSKNPEIRDNVARIMGEIGKMTDPKDPAYLKIVSTLINLLKDADSDVRSAALWTFAMGEVKDRNALEPLIEMLKLNEEKMFVIGALGHLGEVKAVEHIIPALKDNNWRVREKAAWALKEIKDKKAVDSLLVSIKDDIRKVRVMTAWALCEIVDSKSLIYLKKALLEEKDTGVKKFIIEAIGKIEDLNVEHLEEKEEHSQINLPSGEKRVVTEEERKKIAQILKKKQGILQKDLYKEGFV